jgi:CheY-like chemotaxis protein
MARVRVLVVEDESLIRELLVEILSGAGFQVARARPGRTESGISPTRLQPDSPCGLEQEASMDGEVSVRRPADQADRGGG